MKKTLVICQAVVLCIVTLSPFVFSMSGLSDTTISVTQIATDTTWNLAGSPYLIENSFVVNAGVTLTIEPGVVIRLNGDYTILVHGHIKATGTSDKIIVFTSNKTTPASGDWSGIDIHQTGSCEFIYCNFTYGHNIYIRSSFNNIANCNFHRFGSISLSDSSNNNVTDCLFEYGWGISLQSSSYNKITGNKFTNCTSFVEVSGLDKEHWNNTITPDNIADGRPIYYYFAVPPQTLSGINAAHVTFAWSDFSVIHNSIIVGDGIFIKNSPHSSINSCRVEKGGIHIVGSSNCLVSGCNVSASYVSINIHKSKECELRENALWNTQGKGLEISGVYHIDRGYYNHSIPTTNRLNGKPIHYYFNSSNISINDIDAGQVILFWCTDFTLQRGRITGGGSLYIGYSDNITVEGYEIISARRPENQYHWQTGIELVCSNYIELSHCNISRFDDYGLFLLGSSNNTVTNCTIEMCKGAFSIGTLVSHSKNNRIFHNNLIYNDGRPYDGMGGNYYDDGYPNGGNFWSDYEGDDVFSGPNQDLANGDGIGDSPYQNIQITTDLREQGWGIDNYPLMKHVSWETTPPLIMSVSAKNITQGAATIEWRTDELGDSRVNYSIKQDMSSTSTKHDSLLVTKHSVRLDDLQPNTTYYFMVLSTDEQGDIGKDTNYSVYYKFRTLEDTTPPVILLKSPNNNSWIMPGATIDLDVLDLFLDEVLYTINGGANQTFDSPYDIMTELWADGLYNIKIYATDTSGNAAAKIFTFHIDSTGPRVLSTNPERDAVDVRLNSKVEITFNEPMNRTSVVDAISTVPALNIALFLWTGDSISLTLTFSEVLKYNETYTVIVNSSSKDVAGNEMDENFTLSFTATGPKDGDDLDQDGIPDIWEMRYFGNLTYGPDDDPDGDGISNIDEYNAGTDPSVYDKPGTPTPQWWLVTIIIAVAAVVVVAYLIKKKQPPMVPQEPEAARPLDDRQE